MSVDTLMLRGDLPAQVVEALEMIQRNVELEAHFIDGLLDITRISRGKFELSREPMDLHAAIRLAAEVAAPDIEGKAQQFHFVLEATSHQFSGDFKRLQQVFWNLLKNASKFTPERGNITVRSRNEPASSAAAPQIVVEVADTGIGFDAEAAELIFDAFTQANEFITQKFGGLGLGLAISKATIDAHGGTIRGTSPGPGQGATFTVCLPLSEP
jgi:two-component system CheB/CheR fusion protein